MTTAKTIRLASTGIGSLPHHNVDAALDFSFRFDIPFLPQIPIRNPWEYMIAQAVEGLPGIQVDSDGGVCLDLNIWASRTSQFQHLLDDAFKNPSLPFLPLEPGPTTSSCWQPFLWELGERKPSHAKIQIAGPITTQSAIQVSGGNPKDHPELSNQIFQLVLARALGMCARVREKGALPILFIDEPALYGFNPSHAEHWVGLQNLKLMIQTLKKQSVLVGLHCCSDTDWAQILQLPLDFLSIDTDLSLSSLLLHQNELQSFLNRGGRLSLGLVPTQLGTHNNETAVDIVENLIKKISPVSDLLHVLPQFLLSPACGLALRTAEECEFILERLQKSGAHLKAFTQIPTQ